MKRREFLIAGAAASTAVGTLATPAIASGKETWKMVMPWPKGAPGVGVNAQRFADMVTAMSGDRLAIKVYGGGELVPPFECLDAVQNDVAQISHGASYYASGKAKALQYFTTIPFGLMFSEFIGWLYFGGGQALWEEVYAPFNVQPFYAGSSGVQAGGWFRHEINSLDDLKGLKMRIAGLGGEVMRRLGVAVVMTPPGEITTAMLSGTVDAAEWVGPWNDIAFGLHKAAKYYYMPAFHEPGSGLEVIVNKDRYAALPDDLKEIIKRAAQATTSEASADFIAHNVEAFATLDQFGVEKRTWPDDVVKALATTSLQVLDDMAKSDPLTAKVHESYMAFLKSSVSYQKYFDRKMLDMREVAFG